MGTPNYPRNMADEWNKLKRQVKDTYTSANLRKGMAKIGAKVIEVSGYLNITNGRMEVFDSQGQSKIQVGRLEDGSFDLAAFDPATGAQVNLAQLAFGMKGDVVHSSIDVVGRSDNNYDYVTDPEYPGPFVRNVLIGNSKKCVVFINCNIGYVLPEEQTRTGKMSFQIIDDVNGTVTWEAQDGYSISYNTNGSDGSFIRMGAMFLIPQYAFPVANRTYTFEGRYQVRAFNDGKMYFQDRHLIVMPF